MSQDPYQQSNPPRLNSLYNVHLNGLRLYQRIKKALCVPRRTGSRPPQLRNHWI
ncbi:hypothetical protein A2U01_0066145 [Trifolium medium]|uniref:Uncharacterized protein n=1 Tax=Trifolium medium TaxID=97028 RepID=A0A392SAM3_9FABA|nr:hypothetical protein [Trifolium medium]